MTRFADWCVTNDVATPNHKLQVLHADPLRQGEAVEAVAAVVPDHYVMPSRLANMLKRLGRAQVAEYVQTKLPTTAAIRSGDLCELLCTTFVHESTKFNLGIKRLRWKDHRNMAMRGDDVLAFRFVKVGGGLSLRILKAEAKSRATMPSSVVASARDALSSNGGLPAPHAMSFVADRLMESGETALSDAIDDAQLKKRIKPSHVTHMLFSMSGNDPTKMLSVNLAGYAGPSNQHYVGLRIDSHQAFIRAVFDAVEL